MWLLYTILGAALWSLSDVVNSIIIHRYERNAFVIAWFASIFDILFLFVIAVIYDVSTPWMTVLFLGGIVGYFGILSVYAMLQRIDVSVSSAAWALMAIIISAAGFFFFRESWTFLQTSGAFLVLGGVFLLSYWHQHVSIFRTLLILFIPAILYAPYFLVQKAALLGGAGILVTFFWPLMGSKGVGFASPIFHGLLREKIIDHLRCPQKGFLLLSTIVFFGHIVGNFSMTLAYQHGLASLVSTAGNVQPFFTIFFAWILVRFAVTYAPRELLTAQSVWLKCVSFGIVFIGLALLVM